MNDFASASHRPSPARRLAAVGALLAFVAAPVVVVVSLVRHPVQLVVALVLIVLAILAAWTALVCRDLRRGLAAAGAVVAALVLLALPDVRSFVLIAVVAGLFAVSIAAARTAVGRELAPPAGFHRAGPAGYGVLLMNPRSGDGKVERFSLADKARHLGIRPILLGPGDDLRAQAEEAVAEGADVIGMAGGDGSQAIVADVARRHGVAFVCVPAGTRNHFALDLGLDRMDVAAALDAFGDAVERRVDLATVGDRVFVNNVSLGVYATVIRSEGYREAKVATAVQRLPELFGPEAQRCDLRFTQPDGASTRDVDVVLVSNDVYRFRSLNGFGTRSRLDEGVLGVVAVTVNRGRDLPALLSAEATGRIDRFPGYQEWVAPEFEVDSARPAIDVGIDGEAVRLAPPLRFRSLPGALRVRTPVNATARAAPAGLRPTVTALFRVFTGRPAT